MKKIILKNEKICRESWISIGRFCFRSGVIEKALEMVGLSQHLTTAVISTRDLPGGIFRNVQKDDIFKNWDI